MNRLDRYAFIFALFFLVTTKALSAPGDLQEIPLNKLTENTRSPLEQTALAINPTQWRHAETAHFIYHSPDLSIATQVSVEAEFYYAAVAKELERDISHWERKSHVTIFEQPQEWKAFQKNANLEPWTGGIHSGGDLFIVRNPLFKFKGHSLGHEVAHLVLFRFFGNGIPLWLNEGYAEESSSRFYASFLRARGYNARPGSPSIAPVDYLPLPQLIRAVSYPTGENQVTTFYGESQQLVRFLMGINPHQFLMFLEDLSKGGLFETALQRDFSGRFMNLESLDLEFKTYTTKDDAVPQK